MIIIRHISSSKQTSGFTLIEIAIVIVIIGLLIGGISAGSVLIEAARIRAQISQIEKYDAAANTFRIKYGGLAGDFSASKAAQFGFATRTGARGHGDGNGRLEGCIPDTQIPVGCEFLLFWTDLGSAGLIQKVPPNAGDVFPNVTKLPDNALYFPEAAGKDGLYVVLDKIDSTEFWYGLHSYTTLIPGTTGMSMYNLLSSKNAFALDSKIDDGSPIAGSVNAGMYLPTGVGGAYIFDTSFQGNGFCIRSNAYDFASVLGCYVNIRSSIAY